MKRLLFIISFIPILGFSQIYNKGVITIQNGVSVTSQGDVVQYSNSEIDNQGTMQFGGVWENNSSDSLAGNVEAILNNPNIDGSQATYFNNLALVGTPSQKLGIRRKTYVLNQLSLGQAQLSLDSNILVLQNGSTSALSFTNGNIYTDIIEGNPNQAKSIFQWNIGNNTGVYVLPFKSSNGNDLDLSYEVTNAGSADGVVQFSSFTTDYDNTPLASDMNNMDINGLDARTNAINRFWKIDATSYTTQPTANINFAYEVEDLEENIIGNILTDENDLVAYQLDQTGEWNTTYYDGTVDLVNHEFQIAGVTNSPSWWTLSKACSGFKVETGLPDTIFCGGPVVQLTSTNSGSNDLISTTWSPTDSLSCSNCDNPISTTRKTQQYIVQSSDNHGCIARDTVVINVDAPKPEICVISVDTTGKKNIILWKKPADKGMIDSFFVYRMNFASQYEKIGAVHRDSLSEWIDNDPYVNPNITSYRYKLSILDTCGTEGELSEYHETMHLTTNIGVGGVINLVWDNYEGIPFAYYRILRDTTVNGINDYVLLDSVPITNTTYTDFNPPTYPNYAIEIVLPFACTSEKANTYGSTRSNRDAARIGDNILKAEIEADKTIISFGESVQFADSSSGVVTSWEWYFEGGTPEFSTDQHPTVQYDTSGQMDVKLKVKDPDGKEDSLHYKHYIYVSPNGIGESSISRINIYPNPSNGIFNIELENKLKQEVQIEVYNMMNQKVISDFMKDSYELDLLNQSPGVYLVCIITDKGKYNLKIIKE